MKTENAMKRPSLKALDRRPPEPEAPPPIAPKPRPQPSRAGKKVVSVYLSESVWRDLKVLAAKTDKTIDGLMKEGLDRIFAENGINRGAV